MATDYAKVFSPSAGNNNPSIKALNAHYKKSRNTTVEDTAEALGERKRAKHKPIAGRALELRRAAAAKSGSKGA